MPDDISRRIDAIISPLNNPVRQKLLQFLYNGPKTYTEILQHTGLKSGSVYWHLKKMALLIEQTSDKQYLLSATGLKAYQLLFEDTNKEDIEWLSPITILVKRISTAPYWLILQQIILIFLFTSFLFQIQGIKQWGSRIIYSPDINIQKSFISIFVSISLINILLTFTVYLYFRIKKKTTVPKITLAIYLFNNYIFLSPLLITGVITSFFLYFSINMLSSVIFQFVITLLSIILILSLQIAYIIIHFNLSFRESSIIVLLIFYPIVILSYIYG